MTVELSMVLRMNYGQVTHLPFLQNWQNNNYLIIL